MSTTTSTTSDTQYMTGCHNLSFLDRIIFPPLVLETHEHQYMERQKQRAEEMNRTRLYLQNQMMFKRITGSHGPRVHHVENGADVQQHVADAGKDHRVTVHELDDDEDAALKNAMAVFDDEQRKAQEDTDSQQHIIIHKGKTYHCNLKHARRQFASRMLAEFVGTFMLVFAHSAMKIEFNYRYNWVNSTGHALFDGVVLLFLINSLGGISGAHFNPVVTMAFTLVGDFPLVWVLPYYIAQYAGACLAGGFLYAAFTDHAYLGTSSVFEAWSETGGFLWEIALTYFLVFVILCTASKGHNFGPHSALSVCCVIAFNVAIGAKTSSASMNPFRTLGPYTVNNAERPDSIWCFVAGPYIGALIAVITTQAIIANKSTDGAQLAAFGFGKSSDTTK